MIRRLRANNLSQDGRQLKTQEKKASDHLIISPEHRSCRNHFI